MNTKQIEHNIAQKRQTIERKLARLQGELGCYEKPGPEWITTKHLAKILGCTDRNAHMHIANWKAKGFLLGTAKFKTETNFSYRFLIHYKLHPKVLKAYGIKTK